MVHRNIAMAASGGNNKTAITSASWMRYACKHCSFVFRAIDLGFFIFFRYIVIHVLCSWNIAQLRSIFQFQKKEKKRKKIIPKSRTKISPKKFCFCVCVLHRGARLQDREYHWIQKSRPWIDSFPNILDDLKSKNKKKCVKYTGNNNTIHQLGYHLVLLLLFDTKRDGNLTIFCTLFFSVFGKKSKKQTKSSFACTSTNKTHHNRTIDDRKFLQN